MLQKSLNLSQLVTDTVTVSLLSATEIIIYCKSLECKTSPSETITIPAIKLIRIIKFYFMKIFCFCDSLSRSLSLRETFKACLETSVDFPPTLLSTQKFKSWFSISILELTGHIGIIFHQFEFSTDSAMLNFEKKTRNWAQW